MNNNYNLFIFLPQAKDILKIHRKICSCKTETKIKLNLDGVQEAKSSTVSSDIFSIAFNHCRNIYPLKIIRPHEKFKYDEQHQIREVINDVNSSQMKLDTGIFDKPKRSTIKNVKGHAATFPCEYCESPAVCYVDHGKVNEINAKYADQRKIISAQIESLQNMDGANAEQSGRTIALLQSTLFKLKSEEEKELKKVKRTILTWPASTMNGRPRTITSIRRIVNEIEQSEAPLDNEYLKGIKGRSVLLDQQDFDIILDVPCEYMHLVCLGVVKRLVELTFKVGENRTRITDRKLSDPELYNSEISKVRGTREFSRRSRNLLIFYFPIVIDCCITGEYKKECQVWLCLAYVVRACVLPNQEYEKVLQRTLFQACELFYNLFEELFGAPNCTYSIHVFGSHILKVRGNLPLTERSAFMFESYFGEIKNLFQPGTNAPLKQILTNTILKRSTEYHKCTKSIYFSPEKKNLENNHSIYTLDENCNHNLFNIVKDNGDDTFTCNRQGKFEYKNNLTPNWNWNHVGVFRLGPVGDDLYTIKKSDICGKVVHVRNMLITCPINALLEK